MAAWSSWPSQSSAPPCSRSAPRSSASSARTTTDDADRREALLAELRPHVGAQVLEALATVPRDRFVAPEQRGRAWANEALPIGNGQTISQPFVVARMCELLELRAGDRVLDVGTGSGYHAAVLAALGARVTSIERDPELSASAREVLVAAGVTGVELVVGDGTLGHPPGAPYDAITVAAATPEIPPALVEQLADGGRLVLPVGPREAQRLVRVRRRGDSAQREDLEDVRFVPLVGG